MSGRLAAVDRALHALYSRHADSARHDRDRRRYRSTSVNVPFEVFLARVYGLSWPVGALVGLLSALAAFAVPAPVLVAARDLPAPTLSLTAWTALAGLSGFLIGKRLTVRLGGRYLGWRAKARRTSAPRRTPARAVGGR